MIYCVKVCLTCVCESVIKYWFQHLLWCGKRAVCVCVINNGKKKNHFAKFTLVFGLSFP